MAWLSGWTYRKSKTISGSTAGAQTDYQLKLTVYKGIGTDTVNTVYCNNHLKNDFSDIRFTSSDGSTILYYWIESYTSGSVATIWIKIPSIPADPSTATIYVYYDNSTATDLSSGDNTFIFFDDFLGSSLNTSKWSAIGSVYASFSNSIMTLGYGTCNSPDNTLKTISTFPTIGNVTEFYMNPGAVGGGGGCKFWGFGNGILGAWWTNVDGWYARNGAWVYVNNSADTGIASNVDASIWGIYRLQKESTTIMRFYKNDVQMTNSPLIPTFTGSSSIEFYGGILMYIDWVRLRKFSSPEPVFSATGTEETSTCSPPSCNLVVMDLLNSRPGYLDIDRLSRYIDSLIKITTFNRKYRKLFDNSKISVH